MTFDAVVFDLFGTLVPEFSREEFYATVRSMGEALGVDPTAFEAGWSSTSMRRQTGGFATIGDNVRAICEMLGAAVSDEPLRCALEVRAGMYRRLFHPRVGAMETLTELKARGYPIGLISMCAPDAPAM